MTFIAIAANILFASFVLTAILGSHLWSISSSRVEKSAPTRTAGAHAPMRPAPAQLLAPAR